MIGPTVRDGAILYEEISSAADLPEGITDEQEGGTYRLHERDDDALFGFNNGPNSWKHHLFPPNLTLWKAEARGGRRDHLRGAGARSARATPSSACAPATWPRSASRTRSSSATPTPTPTTRPAAATPSSSPINCSKAGNTCFCVSMETGPRAKSGFDLALTELLEGEHRFLVEVGLASAGEEVLAEIGADEAGEDDDEAARPRSPRSARRRWAASSTPTGSRSCSTATWSTRAGTRSPSAA